MRKWNCNRDLSFARIFWKNNDVRFLLPFKRSNSLPTALINFICHLKSLALASFEDLNNRISSDLFQSFAKRGKFVFKCYGRIWEFKCNVKERKWILTNLACEGNICHSCHYFFLSFFIFHSSFSFIYLVTVQFSNINNKDLLKYSSLIHY